MDADERDICLYLKGFPAQFISFGDISKRAAGKRRYRQDPEWATPVLFRMVDKGIIETDSTRHYRLKLKPKKPKETRWLSPEMKKILEENGIFEVDKNDEEPSV